jgi:hypothetical protein
MSVWQCREVVKWYDFVTTGDPKYPPGWNYGDGTTERMPEYVKEILIKEGVLK